MKENQLLLTRLEQVLGKSTKTAGTNHAFHCPFCNHRKKKLEVDLQTNSKGYNMWACWVCGTKGRTIYSLLKKKGNVPSSQFSSILSTIKKTNFTFDEASSDYREIILPESFKLLSEATDESYVAQSAKNYLLNRGLTELDIISYGIGYCVKGEYAGKVVIPSYDGNNTLNFYIGRSFDNSFPKYKNPPGDKDLIFFESRINWNLPVVLVEGVFDAMTAKRNAIPLLGSSAPSLLMQRLIQNNVQEVYVALDQDAMKKALSLSMNLLSTIPRVYLVELPKKDPSDVGFPGFIHQVNETEALDYSSVLKYKLNE